MEFTIKKTTRSAKEARNILKQAVTSNSDKREWTGQANWIKQHRSIIPRGVQCVVCKSLGGLKRGEARCANTVLILIVIDGKQCTHRRHIPTTVLRYSRSIRFFKFLLNERLVVIPPTFVRFE